MGTPAEPGLNEADAARIALAEKWRLLAQLVDEAKSLETESQREPARLDDPRVVAMVRWVTLFARELGAVQAVYEATESGVSLPVDQIRSARMVADKLIEIADSAQQILRQQIAVPA
jgi:hypothetical protein